MLILMIRQIFSLYSIFSQNPNGVRRYFYIKINFWSESAEQAP